MRRTTFIVAASSTTGSASRRRQGPAGIGARYEPARFVRAGRVESARDRAGAPSKGRASCRISKERKWLPGDGGDEYLWSEDIEKPQKHGRTPAKVALENSKHPHRQAPLSLRERAIELAKRNGIVRTKDLEAIGIPRQYPPMMCREGLLIRVGYGVYRAATKDPRLEE